MKGKTAYENVTQPVVVSPREDSASTASSSARASSSAGFPNAARRSGGSRAAPEVGAEGSASNDAHPVSGSRERSGTSGSGTSGSGTFPRGASSETSRATGPASASAASASAPRRHLRRAWPRRRVRRQRVFHERPRFLAGSRDHFRRPREAPAQRGELSVRAEGGPVLQKLEQQTPERPDVRRAPNPARREDWMAHVPHLRRAVGGRGGSRELRLRAGAVPRRRKHAVAADVGAPEVAQTPRRPRGRRVAVFFFGGRRGQTFSGLTSKCATGGRARACARPRAPHTRRHAARPPRRGLQGAVRARRGSPRTGPSPAAPRAPPRASFAARVSFSSPRVSGGTRTSCAWRVTTSSCADTEACTTPSRRASSSESSGGSKHCFSASGADSAFTARSTFSESYSAASTVPSRPSSRFPGPSETLAQRYTRAAPPSANIAPTRNVRPATINRVPARRSRSLRDVEAAVKGFTLASTSRSAFRNRSIERVDARERGSASPSGRHAARTPADGRPETRRPTRRRRARLDRRATRVWCPSSRTARVHLVTKRSQNTLKPLHTTGLNKNGPSHNPLRVSPVRLLPPPPRAR